MVSGALLLNKKYEFNYFFKKRFNRVVIPLIFWSIIYVLFSIFIFLI
jgi:surface polysaccharide O-acyltransferase-like enzyme